ncbi:MAG: signal peptidase II [Candidatus Neomarinimicrobiota bacterium]
MPVVALDQLTKYLVRQNLELNASVAVLGEFFRLTYVENTGIVFGIQVGSALPLFTLFSLVATLLIMAYFYSERTSRLAVRISLAVLLGGAVGNLIDRLLFGRVVDFLDFGIGQYRFFVFNIADSAVTVGVASFLLLTAYLLPRSQGVVDGST